MAAGDEVVDFLTQMTEPKWQPKVLVGVVRYFYGTPGSGRWSVPLVRAHAQKIAETMAVRTTPDERAARCATLLPGLAWLPQPLALLEVAW